VTFAGTVNNTFEGGGDDTIADNGGRPSHTAMRPRAGWNSQRQYLSAATTFTSTSVPQARLNGNLLEIDIDGNGTITETDMQVQLNGLTGTLTNDNFGLV
jgi:hypothetical protein